MLYTGNRGREQKTPNMSVLEEEICYFSSSHQTPYGTDSCGAEEVLILPSSQLYNSIIECSHVSCCSHSANALYPVDVFLGNIHELHEPHYDHGSGLQTVLLHNEYLQRTCMVHSEFSLTEKINLFFTSLINIPPNHFYLIVACLKAHSGLGYKAVHGHNPRKCLQNTTMKRLQDSQVSTKLTAEH